MMWINFKRNVKFVDQMWAYELLIVETLCFDVANNDYRFDFDLKEKTLNHFHDSYRWSRNANPFIYKRARL